MNLIRILLIITGGIVLFSENSILNVYQKPPDDVYFSPHSPYHFHHSRFNRATKVDDLTNSVNRLKMVARVTNVIYLQQGLIAGTILPENLISELLHFGPVKPSQIAAMETAKVQKAVNAMKDFPSKLEKNADIELTETVLKTIESLMEKIDGVGDIGNWSGTDLKEEITELAKDGVNMTRVNGFETFLTDWKSQHRKLMEPYDSNSEALFKVYLGQMVPTIEGITSFMSAGPVWKFNKIKSAKDAISTLAKTSEGAKLYLQQIQVILLFPAKHYPTYANYFENLPFGDFLESEMQSNITAIYSLVSSRQLPNHVRHLIYTAGMPEGSSDLSAALKDVNDSWMKMVLKTNHLSKAFSQFKTMDEFLKTVDSSLEFGHQAGQFAQFHEHFVTMTDAFSKSDETKQAITAIPTCTPTQSTTLTNDISGLIKDLEIVDEKLARLETLVSEILTLLKTNAATFGELANICKKGENGGNIKEVVEEFQTFEQQNNLNAHVVKISGILNNINRVQEKQSMKQHAEDAQKKFPAMDKHHNELKEFSGYFTCLQNQTNLGSVFKAVSQIQHYRGLKDDQTYIDVLDNGMELMKKVVGTKDGLKKIQVSMEGMKGFKSPETDALNNLSNAATHSNVIGSAVQGIANMINALNKKNDVNAVSEHAGLIQKTLDGFRQKLVADDVKNLEEVVTLGTVVEKMYSSLDTFRSKVTDANSTVLAEHSEIFVNAKTVSEVSGDLAAMSVSVGKLVDLVSDANEKKALEDVKMALKTLDTMGLQFSKYTKSFDSSKESLSALDIFFANYARILAPKVTKAPPATATKKIINVASTTNKAFPIVTGKGLSTGWIVFISFAVFVVLVITIFLYYCRNNVCKTSKKKKNIKEKKPLIKEMTAKTALAYAKHTQNTIKAYAIKARLVLRTPKDEFREYFTHAYNTESAKLTLEISDLVEINFKYQRFQMPLVEQNRIKEAVAGYDDFYHGNEFVLPSGQKVFCGQGPQIERGDKFSTMEKFLSHLVTMNSSLVFMLCPWLENGVIQCDRYFSAEDNGEMFFGNYKVVNAGTEQSFDEMCIITNVEIHVMNASTMSCKFKHYQYLEWPDQGAPKLADAVNYMIDRMYDARNPFVHCSDGCGRTGSFLYIASGFQTLCNEGKLSFYAEFEKVRQQRAMAVSCPLQYGFCIYGILNKIDKEYYRNNNDLAYINRGYHGWSQDLMALKWPQRTSQMA